MRCADWLLLDDCIDDDIIGETLNLLVCGELMTVVYDTLHVIEPFRISQFAIWSLYRSYREFGCKLRAFLIKCVTKFSPTISNGAVPRFASKMIRDLSYSSWSGG
jgi:hypothetical protein